MIIEVIGLIQNRYKPDQCHIKYRYAYKAKLNLVYNNKMDLTINPLRCIACQLSLKNNTCYKRHLKTNRHKTCSSATDTPYIKVIKCICGKTFNNRQTIFTHRKKCEIHQQSKMGGVICENVQPPTPTAENQLEAMQKQMIIYEKERIRQNTTVEAMQQTIAVQKLNMDAMQQMIAAQKLNMDAMQQKIDNLSQHRKSRDRRKPISKSVKQTIIDKQQNACGECKRVLSSFFQIDHIIALQFGGTDDESNLMALCCECHAMKSITENRCRTQIQEAIQTILREKLNIDRRV